MSQSLIRYDAACRAIAAARSVDEAVKIRDQAEAMRAYAKIAKNRTLEGDAAEIRIRAERRVGELITAQKDAVGLGKPGRKTAIGFDKNPISLKEVLGDNHKNLADRARKLAAVPEKRFERLVGDWRDRISHETERVTTNLLREGERDQTRVARPAKPLPVGAYRLIYADPPWRYEHIETESRAIENQYPTMSHDELCAIRVPAAEDAVLFLWATSPKLAEAIRVLEAWGFSYRTCAVWDKERLGMGYYFRQQHELLLVAARGSLPVPEPSARPASVLRVKRGKHSAKPALVYELLESMYPAFTERDRIELFNRTDRPGWTAWGNEPAVAS
jgi:N6-adenosine-specific RNA methylase IME4